MKILYLTGGARRMCICGQFRLRDNALATELTARGHDVPCFRLYTHLHRRAECESERIGNWAALAPISNNMSPFSPDPHGLMVSGFVMDAEFGLARFYLDQSKNAGRDDCVGSQRRDGSNGKKFAN